MFEIKEIPVPKESETPASDGAYSMSEADAENLVRNMSYASDDDSAQRFRRRQRCCAQLGVNMFLGVSWCCINHC